jgi:hypothetical protein
MSSDELQPSTTGQAIVAQDRLGKLYSRSQFLAKLGSVLFEVYKCNGPIELLIATDQLYQTYLHLIIVSHPSSIPSALAYRGDVLTAQYELYGDIATLDDSIRFFMKALSYSALADLPRGAINIGFAYALFHRFRVFGTVDDCRASMNHIESHDTLIDVDFFAGATNLIVSSIMKTTRSVWAVAPVTLQALMDMSTRLRDLPWCRLSKSLLLLALLAKVKTCWALAFMTQRKDHVREGLQAADQALRLCPEGAEVIRYQILWERGVLHDLGSTWGMTDMNWRVIMHTAEQLMSSALSGRNSHVQCVSLYSWARASLQSAIEREDVDLMEQSVDALRQCVSICQPNHVFKPFALTQFASTLIAYFKDSGRVSILDEAGTFLDLYSDYIVKHPLLATQIAKLLLLHAQVSDPKTALSRISQAIQICTIRKNAPGFGQADKTEGVAVDLQMIHATRLQLRLGQTPILSPGTILELARQGLAKEETITLRIELFLAKIDALRYMALTEQDNSHLLEAEKASNYALSVAVTTSPIDCIEIVAAQADLCVAQSDMFHETNSAYAATSTLSKAWGLYHKAAWTTGADSSSGGARQRFQVCLRWATQAMSRGHMKEAFAAYSVAIELLPRVVFLGEEVIGRIEALRQVNGLAASSVAVALALGNVSMAVQFLECTRGVLWLQFFRTRTEQLSSIPITLRDRFLKLNRSLDAADSLMWSVRRQTAVELHKVVGEIRTYPNLGRFLLPPLLDDITRALVLHDGYALVLIPGKSSCNVIVLGVPEGPTVLTLNEINFVRIKSLRQGFLTSCTVARKAPHDILRGIRREEVDRRANLDPTGLLSELWISIVQPIFYRLGLLVSQPTLGTVCSIVLT